MTEYLIGLMNVLLPYGACISITYYPMWKVKKARTWQVILLQLAEVAIIAVALRFVQGRQSLGLSTLQVFKTFILLPGILTSLWFFRARLWQCLFTVGYAMMHSSISIGVGLYVGQNHFASAPYPLLAADIASALTILFTLPPLLYLLRKLCENLYIGTAHRLWRVFWLLPATYYGMVVLTGDFTDPQHFTGFTFLMVRVLSYAVMLLACYVLELALRHIANVEAARREAEEMAERNRFIDHLYDMKTEYLSNLGHEMKTPMTVLYLNLQRAVSLSDTGGDPEKIRRAHNAALAETRRLTRLIDSTLQVASDQETRERMRQVDMKALLTHCAEAHRIFLEKRGNALVLRLPETLPFIEGIPDLLVQLMTNLLSNANAHTQNGGVVLRAESDGEKLTIVVRDDGTGISAELMPRVFQRGVSGRGGTGLGLYLCKTIAENHGGTIDIQSEEGQGTTVTVTLPVEGEENA